MTLTNELERGDIRIVDDILLRDDASHSIEAVLECWFDVDRKFGTRTDEDDVWLNVYAVFNPSSDRLYLDVFYDVPDEGDSRYGKRLYYTPTEEEHTLIAGLIRDKLMADFGETPMEFWASAVDTPYVQITGKDEKPRLSLLKRLLARI